MGTQPVNPSIKIARFSDGKVLNISLEHKNKLGEGSFGAAYRIKIPEHPQTLVCKILELQGKSKNIHYAPHQLLRLTYREITYLQKVNMLVGYHHDQKNKRMMILMKYIPGPTECELDKDDFPQAEYASFRALRALHRQNIAHMDPHESNFIYQPLTNTSLAIDFGLAQDYQFFRGLRDFYVFLRKRNNSCSLISEHGLSSIQHLLHFYAKELKSHILANKLQSAQTLFCYAAVVLAAISGVSVLGTAALLAQQLITVTLLQSLSELLETLQEHYEMRAWNRHHRQLVRQYYYFLSGVLAVMQGFLLALQLSQLYYHMGALASFWLDCVNALPVIEFAQILIQMKPLVHACQYWHNNIEKYLYSDADITQAYQHKIEATAHPKSFLPLFQSKHSPAIKPPENADKAEYVSSLSSRKVALSGNYHI